MAEIFSLNDACSTTRRVTKTPPEFDGVLLYPENVKQGGLRTKGLFKRSEADKPLITVVTVVYNGAKFIEETIKSVINQTYSNLEYIVIDGGSTDCTLEIIRNYNDYIDYWISDKDKGIYDAMNKGILASSGAWVNFMNAGDKLLNLPVDVLRQDLNLIYGKVITSSGKKLKVSKNLSVKDFHRGMPVCHQACFYKKELTVKFKYDLNFPICADQILTYHIFKEGKVKYHDDVVAIYDVDGVSSKIDVAHLKEKLRTNIILKFPKTPVFISFFKSVLVRFRDLFK